MMRILCLDIEGGYGGSSRSLYESLRHMDRTGLSVEVWCARAGPIQQRYAELGISCRVVPGMPRFSALPRLSRNLMAMAGYMLAWQRAVACRQALLSVGADLVHCNHESLFGLARWLKRHGTPAVTMHIRTRLPEGLFARWQTHRIAEAVDGLVFITENEEAAFRGHLEGYPLPPHAVIYNVAEPVQSAEPHPAIPLDGRLTVACLSNYAWVRGIDRVVDIAVALKRMGRTDIRFVMAGTMNLSGSLPGLLGEVARSGGDLQAYARQLAVDDQILFLGHVPAPERVLASANLLIKPTREDNPWGRDILEALAAGKPVLSVGRYSRFVETGVTGVLQTAFDAVDMANRIVALAEDRPAIARMGSAGAARVAELCNGADRAADLRAFWLAQMESGDA